jgi:perosamine synthetase
MQNLKKELEIMNKVQVSLSSPDIFDKDIEAVVKVIKTRYLSIGPRVVQFKKKVNEYIGINSISEITSTA